MVVQTLELLTDSNSDNSCLVNFVIPTLKGAGGSSHDSCHTDVTTHVRGTMELLTLNFHIHMANVSGVDG